MHLIGTFAFYLEVSLVKRYFGWSWFHFGTQLFSN